MTSPTPANSRSFRHGNLVEALIAATIEIIEESGVESVSLREASRRAGVSAGAPFRHFSSKKALMTAVAEQAMGRLTEAVRAARERAGDDDPLAGLEAVGQGYLRWAVDNPTHFAIVSSRSLIDFEGSEILTRQNAAIRDMMVELIEAARRQGRISSATSTDHAVLTSRALVYGLARMAVDGHFPEWHPDEPPPQAMSRALHLFITQISARAGP